MSDNEPTDAKKIPGWEVKPCPECQKEGVRVGRPSVGFLGATPSDDAQRYLLDVSERCEDCLLKLGLGRRNYGVPGTLTDNAGMVECIERSIPSLKRKMDERWNYLADHGGIDPVTFEPMQKVPIETLEL